MNDFKFYETLYTILKSKEGSQAVKVDPREDVKDVYIDLRETKREDTNKIKKEIKKENSGEIRPREGRKLRGRVRVRNQSRRRHQKHSFRNVSG